MCLFYMRSDILIEYKSNKMKPIVSKSYKEIFQQHLFTLFNGINVLLAILVFFTGSYRNMLFMGTVILNTCIGLFQEIRSKRMLDRLSLLHQAKIHVLKDGKEEEISVEEVIEQDILILRVGDEICCDGKLIEGQIECNESILTGESDAILKEENAPLLAGSFVVSGQGKMRVEKVGEDTYAYSILKHAKRYKRYPSQLRDSINTIIRLCTMFLIPLGTILFIKQRLVSDYTQATLNTVAAVIGMIPEGLVFLTSVALAIGAYKLAKQNVLVQELYCIETLARVDVLCLDKTGTLTKGNLVVSHMDESIQQIVADMYAILPDDNATTQAIRKVMGKPKRNQALSYESFSSQRKYASVTFEEGTYYFGAYSYIVKNADKSVVNKINEYASRGMRVLTLVKDENVLGMICLEDELRENVQKNLDYFKTQGVQIKIISGDDPTTVKALAKKANLSGKMMDLSGIDDVSSYCESYSIFGRVTPTQKLELVKALQANGHTVAMTGDGVNDVMALKEADCSIAMDSGSQACKNVASLVLLENQFDALPSILHQGRCIINNIQRTASLFLVKTIFSFGLSILTLFFIKKYPFQPIQLTLISALATGIPSFILTLEPNGNRVKGNFLMNVFSKAIPGASCVIVSVICCYVFKLIFHASYSQFSTMCMILAGANALVVLTRICRPFSKLRRALVIFMTVSFFVGIFVFSSFFYIVSLQWRQILYLIVNILLIPVFLTWMTKIMKKYQKQCWDFLLKIKKR